MRAASPVGFVAGALSALVTIVTMTGVGCGDEEVIDPTLSAIQEKVFNASCTQSTCHDSSAPEADLDLTAGIAHSSLVNVTGTEASIVRVVPGDPDNSLLYQAIMGIAPAPIEQMPVGGILSDAAKDAIKQWITDGAQNN